MLKCWPKWFTVRHRNWMVELEKYNDTEQSAKRLQLAIKQGAES